MTALQGVFFASPTLEEIEVRGPHTRIMLQILGDEKLAARRFNCNVCALQIKLLCFALLHHKLGAQIKVDLLKRTLTYIVGEDLR